MQDLLLNKTQIDCLKVLHQPDTITETTENVDHKISIKISSEFPFLL